MLNLSNQFFFDRSRRHEPNATDHAEEIAEPVEKQGQHRLQESLVGADGMPGTLQSDQKTVKSNSNWILLAWKQAWKPLSVS